MQVKFKKENPNAVMPLKTEGNAGLDMTAISKEETSDFVEYDTGIAIEIPEGYVGLLFPRSSVSKMDLTLCNSVGVIDPSYRGTIRFRYKCIAMPIDFSLDELDYKIYNVGDRVGQLIIMPYPDIELVESDALTSTDRGDKGYGSTGR